jgi:hypothetical protein
MVDGFLGAMKEEISLNAAFIQNYPRAKVGDYALPCGLYTEKVISLFPESIERIYTVDGGLYDGKSRVVPRCSLVSPAAGGPLLDQVEKSLHPYRRIRRKIVNYRYAHPYFRWL